jgi:Na+-transporting methylmalonyl-CoA/oxaloacetate decarboxylase gamma subunit
MKTISKEAEGCAVTIMGMGVLIVLVLIFWVFPAYFEARAFNRLTGRNASTWEAMWVELRVQ